MRDNGAGTGDTDRHWTAVDWVGNGRLRTGLNRATNQGMEIRLDNQLSREQD